MFGLSEGELFVSASAATAEKFVEKTFASSVGFKLLLIIC